MITKNSLKNLRYFTKIFFDAVKKIAFVIYESKAILSC